MSVKVGDKALSGEWEEISNKVFEITESLIMEFQGKSCNILDGEGNVLEQLSEGYAEREVDSGYRCYVMKAKIRFTKR